MKFSPEMDCVPWNRYLRFSAK